MNLNHISEADAADSLKLAKELPDWVIPTVLARLQTLDKQIARYCQDKHKLNSISLLQMANVRKNELLEFFCGIGIYITKNYFTQKWELVTPDYLAEYNDWREQCREYD